MNRNIVSRAACVGFILACTSGRVLSEENRSGSERRALNLDIADRLEYLGIAAAEENQHVWGCSPIRDEQGRYHLFGARYAGPFNQGWRTDSHIAHYVADTPEGPFKFVEVVYRGERKEIGQWNYFGVHNPTIKKVDGKYVLFFICNSNAGGAPRPANQSIGMMTAPTVNGPWSTPVQVLKPSADPDHWTFQASNGVNNPAFLKGPDGRYYLYYKSAKSKYGVAIAETLEGPYVHHPENVTRNDKIIEDGYAFMYKDEFCLFTTDNHGTLERGGGLRWISKDGINFDAPVSGFHVLSAYVGEDVRARSKQVYASFKLERPQLLLIDGEPAYLYAPVDIACAARTTRKIMF